MSKAFYRAISGTGSGLKRAWDTACGDRQLKARGLAPHNSLKVSLLITGGFCGFFGGEIAALASQHLWLWPVALGGGLALPVAGHLTYATYQAGKHDYKIQQIEDKRKEQLKLTAPEQKRGPGAPLI
jgi:hypothetical protein